MLRLTVMIMLSTAIFGVPYPTQASYYHDISHGFLPNELSEVLVGEESVPIFESPSTLPLSRGVVLILAQKSDLGLSLINAKQLAQLLNEKGWYTVVSPAPVAIFQEAESENLTDIHPKSDSRALRLDYAQNAQRLTMLMQALHSHISSHQGFRVVVAQGMNAAQLLALSSQDLITDPDTLVTLSPYWPTNEQNQRIPSLVATSDFPLLDISVSNFNTWEQHTVTKRKTLSHASLKLHYRQHQFVGQGFELSLHQNDQNPIIQSVANKILGWMKYLGW